MNVDDVEYDTPIGVRLGVVLEASSYLVRLEIGGIDADYFVGADFAVRL